MCDSIRRIDATRMSLNERFSTMVPHTGQQVTDRRRSRSRSRSMPRGLQPVNRETSLANRRLLQQLAKKHKFQAAMKLKRRSMRTFGGSTIMKRGSIKALRVAANGKPIKTNSLTRVATMKADMIANGNRNGRPLRRASSYSSVSNRLGSRRPQVGGAAQRVARRRLERLYERVNPNGNRVADAALRRGRSRSRSRGRFQEMPNMIRGRSRSRGRVPTTVRGVSRGRSRSRSRITNASARAALPIKARLGVRPNAATGADRSRRRGDRGTSVSRGVAQGRIERRRNSVKPGSNNNMQRAGGAGGRIGRTRGRLNTRNTSGRSRSRVRRGAANGQRRSNSVAGNQRGRSQQRRGRRGAIQQNGNANSNNGQQQQRRGRSRSRGAARGGGRGGRNQGKTARVPVDKDVLDKELDQYMATPKTDMDYLLKN